MNPCKSLKLHSMFIYPLSVDLASKTVIYTFVSPDLPISVFPLGVKDFTERKAWNMKL